MKADGTPVPGVETGELVSRQEAARLAGVHVNTIRLWEDHGRLHPAKQENGRVLILMSELEAVVRERREPSNAEERLVELEAEIGVLRAENKMLRDQLEQTRSEHSELLRTVIDLARRKESGET